MIVLISKFKAVVWGLGSALSGVLKQISLQKLMMLICTLCISTFGLNEVSGQTNRKNVSNKNRQTSNKISLGKLSSADEILWYDRPAQKWTDALPLGNGRMGAMVFGGTVKDRIQFNEETLWTGFPRDYDHPGAAVYLPELRKLLASGKQGQAEKLADEHFMGLKGPDPDKAAVEKAIWTRLMYDITNTDRNPAQANFPDGDWKTITVPSFEGWEAVGLEGLDGAVWFRTTFDLPAALAGQNLVLDLNKIRDLDYTYINGKLVGHTKGELSRKYVVPASALKTGKNVLAIQVLNFADKGGIAGYKDTTHRISIRPAEGKAGRPVFLDGKWKYWIQDSHPPAVPRFQADYQPFGDLILDFGKEISATSLINNYRRDLDLGTAISRTSYQLNGITYTREYFVSQPDQVIVVHLSASKPGMITLDASLSSPHQNSKVSVPDGNTLAMDVQVRDGALKGQSQLRASVQGGSMEIKQGSMQIRHASEVTLYLTAATNYVNFRDVSGRPQDLCHTYMSRLSNRSYENIRKDHIKEYQRYYQRFAIRLGDKQYQQVSTDRRLASFDKGNDPSFAALYLQYGRYLLISSSRPGTRPANLQGIWNDLLAPPWGSKYTTNINLEMNYWPAEVLNLSAMHQPLFNMIDELAISGKKTAATHYGASGWVLHHNTDIWRGTAPINSSTHGIWVTGAAWLTTHLWEHYRYTQDKAFLAERAYPRMKAAAEFFVDFLVKDQKTGWLISTPSNSPENGGMVAGPTMDHQIIRVLFDNCIKASEILNKDEAFRKILQEKFRQIAPNQIGRHGQLQEWLEDIDDPKNNHRHVSHLWGVHPGNDITWDKDTAMMKAARQSLLFRGDEGTGWSLAWKINFWSRFKDGDHAMKMIKMLISPVERGGGAYLNLFDAHPPFQIDGNFGGAAGIAEMLLQSHTDYIDILPALPKEFQSGEVSGICARGGFVIDMRWSANQLQELSLRSQSGKECVMRYHNQVVRFPTVAGKTYKLNGMLKLHK